MKSRSVVRAYGRRRKHEVGKYRDLDIVEIECPAGDHITGLSMGSIVAHDNVEKRICEYSGQEYKPNKENKEDAILRQMFGD